MNICVFCGARPNFMKVAPVIRQIENLRREGKPVESQIVYAGIANDPTLEDSLFSDLGIRRPDVFLGVDCVNLNELTGQVMSKFEVYLQDHLTDVVVVVDDLASTMAASIVTKKQGIRLAHIAAGTRSFDINMPKEINRLVIDGLSDILFTAGISNNSIANREGAELSKVYMVGNILMDNLRYCHTRIEQATLPDEVARVITAEDGRLKPYLVFTINRKALLADKDNLKNMITALARAAGDTTIIAPLRGLAEETITGLGLRERPDLKNFHIVTPLGYLAFARLTRHASGIITDSGNVAEEATFNQVPCITLNSYTEHIETVKIGTNVLVGEDAEKLEEAVGKMAAGQWKQSGIPDRWDGRTAERIVEVLMNE